MTTKYGKPVARLLRPVHKAGESGRSVAEQLLLLREGVRSQVDWKTLRDQGRG
jgi:hypothetical protein